MVLPDDDKYSTTRNQLLDQLAYSLGGRAAEELIFHDQSTGASNVTGDGTAYVVTTWTEEFENNNGTNMFDTATGIFTAPITGLYRFEMAVSLSDAATSGFTSSQLALTLSGSTPSIIIDKQFGANNVMLNGSALVAINRGATARLTVTASGGSLTADIPANAALTYWSGMLVA
jgi:hypothetical protein